MKNLLKGLLLAFVLVSAFLLASHSLGDLDIWFHWRAGQDILAGHLPRTNHYGFTTPDRPWVDHEWLFQVLVAGVGKAALALNKAVNTPAQSLAGAWNALRIALILFLVFILGRPLSRFRNHDQTSVRPAWLAAALMLGLGLMWPRMTMRPELISYLLLAAAVPLAENCLKSRPGQRPALRLILEPRTPCGGIFWLSLLWAQFHGFAILGPGILLLAGLLNPAQKKLDGQSGRLPRSRWAWTLLLSWAALGLTPAGWRGWTYPLTVLNQFSGDGPDLKHTISELVPLASSPHSLAWTIILFKICLAWGLLRIALSWPRPNLLRTFLFLAAALAAWSNQRNLGFMAVTFVLLHRGPWGNPAHLWPVGRLAKPWRTVEPWLPVVLVLVLVGTFWPRIVTDSFYLHEGVGRRFGTGLTPAHYPAAAARALDDQPRDRVFANLDAAAYLLGNTSSRLFIDGRTEAYPPAAWKVYNRIKSGSADALDLLDKYSVTAVCLALGSGTTDQLAGLLIASERWSVETAGPGGILWVRTDNRSGRKMPESILMAAVDSTRQQAAMVTARTRRADVYLAAARLSLLAGNTDPAAAALRQGLKDRPDHPVLLHNLGNLELAAKDFPAAEKCFAQAFATNPRMAGSALNAGVCALGRGNPRAAEQWFRKSLQVDADNYQAWANLGTARLKSGDRPGAIAAFAKAVALRPSDARLRRRLQQLRSQS